MTALVLVLGGVAAGDGGMNMGAATAPVAVDLGGRWVGTHLWPAGPKRAELNNGVLLIGPQPYSYQCRFTASGRGPEGTLLLVRDRRFLSAASYRLERGRLVICDSQAGHFPTAFGITRMACFIVLKPAAPKR